MSMSVEIIITVIVKGSLERMFLTSTGVGHKGSTAARSRSPEGISVIKRKKNSLSFLFDRTKEAIQITYTNGRIKTVSPSRIPDKGTIPSNRRVNNTPDRI